MILLFFVMCIVWSAAEHVRGLEPCFFVPEQGACPAHNVQVQGRLVCSLHHLDNIGHWQPSDIRMSRQFPCEITLERIVRDANWMFMNFTCWPVVQNQSLSNTVEHHKAVEQAAQDVQHASLVLVPPPLGTIQSLTFNLESVVRPSTNNNKQPSIERRGRRRIDAKLWYFDPKLVNGPWAVSASITVTTL